MNLGLWSVKKQKYILQKPLRINQQFVTNYAEMGNSQIAEKIKTLNIKLGKTLLVLIKKECMIKRLLPAISSYLSMLTKWHLIL